MESKTKVGAVAAAASLIISAPIVLYRYFGDTGLQVASIVTTGLLTLALVTLYFQQYTVLDRQTQLMRQDFESELAYRGQITVEEDTIYINLRNIGRGAIRFIYLKSEIISDTGSLDVTPGRTQLSAVDNGSASLPGFSDVREFKGRVRFLLGEEDEERSYPFKFIPDKLAREGIEECRIRLTLSIVDETTESDDDIKEFQIVEQDLELGGIKKKEEEMEDGETKVIEYVDSTELEDAIKGVYPQDMVPRDHPLFDFD